MSYVSITQSTYQTNDGHFYQTFFEGLANRNVNATKYYASLLSSPRSYAIRCLIVMIALNVGYFYIAHEMLYMLRDFEGNIYRTYGAILVAVRLFLLVRFLCLFKYMFTASSVSPLGTNPKIKAMDYYPCPMVRFMSSLYLRDWAISTYLDSVTVLITGIIICVLGTQDISKNQRAITVIFVIILPWIDTVFSLLYMRISIQREIKNTVYSYNYEQSSRMNQRATGFTFHTT